jgi:undecaprenyl pyrophosphate phosphatase UppP
MNRNKIASMVAVVLSLATIPAVWMFAFGAIPSLEIVKGDQSGGRMGPWVFTWALVWVATIAAVVVAWLCYVSLDDSRS